MATYDKKNHADQGGRIQPRRKVTCYIGIFPQLVSYEGQIQFASSTAFLCQNSWTTAPSAVPCSFNTSTIDFRRYLSQSKAAFQLFYNICSLLHVFKDSVTFGPEHHRIEPHKHKCMAFFLHFLYKMYFVTYKGVAISVNSTLLRQLRWRSFHWRHISWCAWIAYIRLFMFPEFF